MERTEKIDWLINAIILIEGVALTPDYFAGYSDAQIEDEIDWLEYLLTK